MGKLFQKWNTLLSCMVLLLIGIGTFAVSFRQTAIGSTDISIHMSLADAVFHSEYAVSYPGWFFTCGMLSQVFRLPLNIAAALTSSFYNVLCFAVIYLFLRKELSDSKLLHHAIVLFMAFYGPLYLNIRDIYNSSALFNTWHNPTNTSVKFLTVLCFALVFYSADMQKESKTDILGKSFTKRKIDCFLSVAVLASLLFKPSFFQVLAPTLCVIYFVQLCRGKKSFSDCFKDCLIYVPALLLVIYQMFDNFGGADEGIQIAFLRVWRVYSSNIPISFLSMSAFPLFVTLFCVKDWKEEKIFHYAIVFFLVAVSEFAVLAETGERWADGNFGWGKNLANGILFLNAIITFVKFIRGNCDNQSVAVKIKSWAGCGLILAHFSWGMWYYVQLLLQVNGRWY